MNRPVVSIILALLLSPIGAVRAEYSWPTQSTVIREDFGPSSNPNRDFFFQGIEIDAAYGDVVRTVEAGTVKLYPGAPDVVEVRLANGRAVRFGHLFQTLVDDGQSVVGSPVPTPIGQVGNINNTDGTSDPMLGLVFTDSNFTGFRHPLIDLPYNDTAAPREPKLLKNVGGTWSELVDGKWYCRLDGIGARVDSTPDMDLNVNRLSVRLSWALPPNTTEVDYDGRENIDSAHVIPKAVGDDQFVFSGWDFSAVGEGDSRILSDDAIDARNRVGTKTITIKKDCTASYLRDVSAGTAIIERNRFAVVFAPQRSRRPPRGAGGAR